MASQQNVDLVLESTRRFVAGDMEGLAKLYTPDAVGFAMEGWPEAGPFDGREAVIRQYERLQESWEEQTNEAVRTLAHGDWVAVEWLWNVRGAGSGIRQTMSMSAAYRISHERIAEVRFFWNWEDAIEVVGDGVEAGGSG